MNYKNGVKNNWRGAVWNDIRSRISNRRDALVLYLPGNEDADRPEACRRGFKPDNLVAVEKDPGIVARLRKSGKNVIRGNLDEVLFSWPVDKKISVLIADYCCGWEHHSTRRLFEALAYRRIWDSNSAILVNMQRGRDRLPHWFSCGLDDLTMRFCPALLDGEINRRSRAAMFIVQLYIALFSSSDYVGPEVTQYIRRRMRPVLRSYRASKVWMDSAVFTWPPVDGWDKILRTDARDPQAMRKVAATLAIRTQRKLGRLPHSPVY